jgi:hypothetical protein
MFLIHVVQRALQELVPQVGVWITPLHYSQGMEGLTRQIDKMIYVARFAYGWGLIVFHLDADSPDTKKAFSQRFEPGYKRILEEEDANHYFVPVIPVRMTPAWMLVDCNAFCQVLGVKLTAKDLGFPERPHQVESIQNPERVFESAVWRARPGRRRRIPLEDVYGPLGRQVRLDLLEKIPAYNEFLGRLRDTLRDLHYIESSEGGTH